MRQPGVFHSLSTTQTSARLKQLFTVIAMAGAAVCSGADYYVSPGGDDANAGTSELLAWRTILKVNSRNYAAGDRILFSGGATFAGNLYFAPASSGTPSNPVVISSYGSGRATINAGNGFGIYSYNNGGFTISNLNLVGSGAATNSADGISFYNDLGGNVKKPFLCITDVDVSGFGGYGGLIGGANGASGYTDVWVISSAFHHNRKSGLLTYGPSFSPASPTYALASVYVGVCRAYDNDGDPGATKNTGNGIVLGSVQGGTVEYCVAHDNGINNQPNEGPVGLWTYDSTGVKIQYCESYRNRSGSSADGGGFDLDQNVTSSILQYNYSHDNDGAGYLVYAGTGKPNSNNVVRYNISENDSVKNSYGGIVVAGDITNCDIYNNTVYVTSRVSVPAALKIAAIGSTPANVRVRNNLFFTHQGSAGSVALVQSVDGATYQFQGNNYFNDNGVFAITWGGATYSSLAAWLAAVPAQERVSGVVVARNVNPLLTNPGAGGTFDDATRLTLLSAYELQAASPLIDAGLTITSLDNTPPIPSVGVRDFYGNTIFQGATFDIGAHDRRPVLSVSASVPGATEFGLVAGEFTISRTGATAVELAVASALIVDGSATGGADYAALPSTLNIPAGSSATKLAVVPIADASIEGTETTRLSLTPSPFYEIGGGGNATVSIADRPFDEWRSMHFPPTQWLDELVVGPFADPLRTGATNLAKYALGIAAGGTVSDLATDVRLLNGSLELTFDRVSPDVVYTVQGSSELSTWTDIAVNPGAVGETVTVRDPETAPARFLRLRVELAP